VDNVTEADSTQDAGKVELRVLVVNKTLRGCGDDEQRNGG